MAIATGTAILAGAAVAATGAAVVGTMMKSAGEKSAEAAERAAATTAEAQEKSAAEMAAANERAAQLKLQAEQESIAEQRRQFDETKTMLAPWREAGEESVNVLRDLVMAGPGEFTESPGYDWRVGEGVKALERSASAKGQQLSGKQEKAITKFGQDYATYEYDNFLRRWYESLIPYQGLSASGQVAATNTGQFGQSTAANISNIQTGTASDIGNALIATAQNQATNRLAASQMIGNAMLTAGKARASGYENQANVYTDAVGNIVNNALLYNFLSKSGGSTRVP